jgi:hypothetical protein
MLNSMPHTLLDYRAHEFVDISSLDPIDRPDSIPSSTQVRAAAAVAEEEAASERERSEEKMAELFAKLEDAEAGLKSAKAEAKKAKEQLKEAQRELSALLAKVITRTSLMDVAHFIENCSHCESTTQKAEAFPHEQKAHTQNSN